MDIFKKLYYRLFNNVTDCIRQLQNKNDDLALEMLINAQCEAEEFYISNSICAVDEEKAAEIIDFPNAFDISGE